MSVTVLYDESALNYIDIFVRSITTKDGIKYEGGSLGDVLYNDGNFIVPLPIGSLNQVLTVGPGNIPTWTTGGGAVVPDPLTINQLNLLQKFNLGDNLATNQLLTEYLKGGNNYTVSYNSNLLGSGGPAIEYSSTQPISSQWCYFGTHPSPGRTQIKIGNGDITGSSVYAVGLYPTPNSIVGSKRVTTTLNGTTNTWAIDVAQDVNPVQNFIEGTFSPSGSTFSSFSIGKQGIASGTDIEIGTLNNFVTAEGGLRTNNITSNGPGLTINVSDQTLFTGTIGPGVYSAVIGSGVAPAELAIANQGQIHLLNGSTLEDNVASQGSMWFFDATKKRLNLPLGTANQILRVDPTASFPEWVTASGMIPDPLPVNEINVNTIRTNPPGEPAGIILDDLLTVQGHPFVFSGASTLTLSSATVVNDVTPTTDGFLWWFNDANQKQELEFGNPGEVLAITGTGKAVEWVSNSTPIPDPLAVTTLRTSNLTSNPIGGTIQIQDDTIINTSNFNFNTSSLIFNSTSSMLLASATALTDQTATTNGFIWYFDNTGVKQELEHGAASSVLTINALGTTPEYSKDLNIDSIICNAVDTDVIVPKTGTTLNLCNEATDTVVTRSVQMTTVTNNPAFGSGVSFNAPVSMQGVQLTLAAAGSKLQYGASSTAADAVLNITGGIHYFNTSGDLVRLPITTGSPVAGSVLTTNATNNGLQFTNSSTLEFPDGVEIARASDPTGIHGLVYWNTTSNELRGYNGTTWQVIGPEAPNEIGHIYMASNAVSTTFTAINTATTIGGTTTNNANNKGFDSPANHTLRYTGTKATKIKLTMDVRYTGDDNAGLEFKFFKNGSLIAGAPFMNSWCDDLNSTGQGGTMTFLTTVTTNDTFKVFVYAVTNTNPAVITNFSLYGDAM